MIGGGQVDQNNDGCVLLFSVSRWKCLLQGFLFPSVSLTHWMYVERGQCCQIFQNCEMYISEFNMWSV
jgi:hypothetical protein